MKYVSFLRPDGSASYGRLDGDKVYDLAQAGSPADLKAAIAGGALAQLENGQAYDYASIKLLPVVPNPGKVLCVGHNYESHRKETGRDPVANPSIFTRFADTLIAHGDDLICPKVSTDFDFEAELAIIISKPGRHISEADAADYIAGYACFNDASVRDWQWHTRQFTPGKNFPGTAPFGPFMMTPDEAGDISEVHVISRLNGEVMQDQPVKDMIFPIAQIIAYVSAFTPLSPGDVIATGTPGGVGAKRTPPVWLKPGDTIEIDCGPFGVIKNTVTKEQ
ncbi:fumarylacetoacetate hydrolase family protein [Halioxenophilus aromaticivorans]|uniref:Fumarylacetoacetate hydrolase family protein n=1 Tax=Halioxenophilus aromaticivorans TaxID=1306992 RepID=A0AAV3U318_9ALTE